MGRGCVWISVGARTCRGGSRERAESAPESLGSSVAALCCKRWDAVPSQ